MGLGHSHITTKELLSGACHILKDSHIFLNAWAIKDDPYCHLDPERFRPERYERDLTASKESKNASNLEKRDYIIFRARRCICIDY